MDFNLSQLPGRSATSGETHLRLLILGSGPAGLAAALYAARADFQPVVLSGMEMGGQVSLTYAIENYPGFPEGIGGIELVELFKKQAERFGARIEFDTAVEADLIKRPFYIKTYNTIYRADALIISTGATPRHLNVSGEIELTGRGVSYCATCDGWFYKEKDVVVIGGGDSALEEGLFLTRYARSVTIVHRRNQLRAGAILQNRAHSNEKIKFIWDSVVEEIIGSEVIKSVRLKNVVTGESWEHATDGLFIFIGHTPNTEIFRGQLGMDELGYIQTNHLMHTNIPGVYAAGEAADPHFRQVITSAGMGAAAAIQASHFLDQESG